MEDLPETDIWEAAQALGVEKAEFKSRICLF